MKVHFLRGNSSASQQEILGTLSFCNLLQKCLSVCSHEHYSTINFVRNLYCSAFWLWSLTKLVSRRCHQFVKVTKKKRLFKIVSYGIWFWSDNLGFELSQFWLWYYAEIWTLSACMCQNHRIPQLKSNCRSLLWGSKVAGVLVSAILGLPLGSPRREKPFGCGSHGKVQSIL
jgi:hypothetical protein